MCARLCVCACVCGLIFFLEEQKLCISCSIYHKSVGVYTAASRSLFFFNPLSAREIYTRNQHSGKTKEGDEQPPKDQSFQRLFVKMLEPEARRDSLDFLEDGAQAMKRDFLYM